ncbi:MAG: GNAT family N-acetyltransferase [Chitinophagaceae bacterium]
MNIDYFNQENFNDLCHIYLQGINTGIATFQTDLPTWESWNSNHLQIGRIGMFDNQKLVGWCSLAPVSNRLVYKGVAEISIYIHENYWNKGIASKLLQQQIVESEKHGIWTLQSSIFPENKASIKVHEKAGFRMVGIREKIGLINGIWKDNLLFERRSKLI